MMLKFKAWDKDKKVMSIIDEIDFNSGYILISTGYKSFDEVKLLQYTDLKDKNNTEIYDGDIVEFDTSLAYEYGILNKAIVTISNIDGVIPVLFTVEECGDIVEWSYFEKDIDELDFFDDCKIIGNIYETPHLL
ncbi:YopX family protein [Staphylococcus aureus]|uniref:YopX family protein n=1 Tax=Staphylococcus aureus TaxID=1280 RepID=A0AAW4Y9Y2_STAAU|nr:YopX family protein [Staphylococcus aureus]MCE3304106.1 YopX family protein [Staphylococcus aureus]MCE3335278.1 YopX family protein [Staphylococcus aureus]MCE3363210.1 YopX family protein [Staphylococcus aureus]MCE3379178.1 YopX family protein [Staphylococcus aureus]MCE3382561.1 YopX family protein [Staphylococcus aureus]